MGRYSPYRNLPDQAYDPRVTDLDKPLRAPKGPAPVVNPDGSTSPGGYVNRNRANTITLQIIGAQPSVRVLPANSRRSGLLLQNKDSVNAVNFAFGNQADANAPQLAAQATLLLDFTTPQDELWLFSSASNILVAIVEITRGVG